ncbi:hypothetical protein KW851_26560 [Pseudomonas sp. PDM33]|uniref:hypothetical protein n=1 Tax=unclassified Pseudomonas TaxID=196821 RepID=UPI0012E03A45|nr:MULTISPECIES: hypothetical protein [unclassified Pseudomonas]MBV7586421.1 hypothetical protein [Pseudomonas sp. PDM33]
MPIVAMEWQGAIARMEAIVGPLCLAPAGNASQQACSTSPDALEELPIFLFLKDKIIYK